MGINEIHTEERGERDPAEEESVGPAERRSSSPGDKTTLQTDEEKVATRKGFDPFPRVSDNRGPHQTEVRTKA